MMSLHWLCLCNHVLVVSGLCLDEQRSLLLQLKKSITFRDDIDKRSSRLTWWNASHDCCSWMGVTCDLKGHVTGLDLSEEFIQGGFDNSSVLFSLQHLQKLNLAFNDFHHEIPARFNKLDKLSYLNLSTSSFMGQIPIEISQLTRLVTLDLSVQYFRLGHELIIKNPSLLKLVQNLTSIRQLYLDGVIISASGHEWCNALLPLHDLQELSMSGCNLSGPLVPSLATLKNLSVIVLYWNNLSSPVPQTFAHFKDLTILNLASCRLTGTFPQVVFNIETLSFIDISNNDNLHGFFPDFPLSGSLQTLKVGLTMFGGALPHSIGNMRHLAELDLSNCGFKGRIPNSLSNLTELISLDLASNNFIGPMPPFDMAKNLTSLYLYNNDLSGTIPSSHFEGLHNLESIYLSSNSFTGAIPSSLFTLRSLRELWLDFNQFDQFQLEEFMNVSSSILDLDLSCNNLSGPFPTSFFQLTTLSILKLSSNNLNGSTQLNKLWELKGLDLLDLSYNNLSDNVNFTNVEPSSFPNLTTLTLISCDLRNFPVFLRSLSTLVSLDLSDNQIQGIVPNWIWKLHDLYSLNISQNYLTHLEGPLPNLNSNLNNLDLHCNKLQGPLPIFAKYAMYLDFSSNKFSTFIPQDIGNYLSQIYFLSLSNNTLHGSIPDSICNASQLQVLDLSINNISGIIPPCLMMMSDILEVLNLKNNNLSGFIPNTMTAACSLWTLDLHGNLLDGPIPKSIVNCSKLEVLDLGSNQIIDGFPCFLKEISQLRILVLRNNKFQGSMRCAKTNTTWEMLQIVDIALNNFSGQLPRKFLSTWKRFIIHNEVVEKLAKNIDRWSLFRTISAYYQISVSITKKGLKTDLVTILTIYTCIDFSSNRFEGPIPEELMEFKELHFLNLSNNALSGEIPSTIGNMRQLESLDFSQNSLNGEIPVQIASLTFLSYLNLSFNHLVGKIPTGTQIQSFQASSFEGNNGLYGSPLPSVENRNGTNSWMLPQQKCGKLVCTVDWNFISVEVGLVFGHGIVFGPILIWKGWRIWYWKLIHKILCWIFPQMYLEYVTQRGQPYTTLRWGH
ncbi:hypothetical protein Fmac_012160 [Flemingia macrophylla]|uniref:Leucine-rich repeat-containing N-terminal plant-type domain-containing protein n=1 Tax=Flemingia macrophylla TaxID=520843 RepID=A0ABD1MPJ4_9FABA